MPFQITRLLTGYKKALYDSEDMFTQTFKFQKGNWLLVSHDATGLDAVSIPINTHNTEDRIINTLNK